MSRFKRSFFSRVQLWVGNLFHRCQNLRGVRYVAELVQLVSREIRRSLFRSHRHLTNSLTESEVASRAKVMAQRGRRLEVGVFASLLRVGKKVARVAAALTPRPVRRLLVGIPFFFGRCFLTLFEFSGRWFQTRHYKMLLGGLPAILIAVPIIYFLVQIPLRTPVATARHYRAAVSEALSANELESAALFYRKLNQLGAVNDGVEFQSAVKMYEVGDVASALAKMKTLAPDDRAVFVPAHLWMAQWYLNQDPDASSVSMELVRRHLEHAMRLEPNNLDARTMMARLYRRSGRFDQAIAELQSVVRLRPEQGLNLASVYARQGRWNEAQRELQRVIQRLEDLASQAPLPDPTDYLGLALAHRSLGDTQATLETLQAGHEIFPEHEDLSKELFQACLDRAEFMAVTRTDQGQQACEYLLMAHRLKPDSMLPLLRLAKLTRRDGSIGLAATAAVNDLLEANDPPPQLFSIMGPLVGAQGELQQAQQYLERALDLMPEDPSTLNNLAYVLSQLASEHHASEHHARALDLIDRAIAQRPMEPAFRETRGQIRLRLGQTQDAIDDLIFALNGFGDRPDIHATLADAYEQLGFAEQAGHHRQRAE